MNLFFSFQSEWLKRRRSAASWLTLVGGLFIPAIMLSARLLQRSKTLQGNSSDGIWNTLFNQCWQYMSIFLLPMGITLAASLITQIEYRNNGWKQLHTTPQSLTIIFWAKFGVVLAMLVQFFLLFNLGIYLVGVVPALVYADVPLPAQTFPWMDFLEGNAKFFINCLPMLGLQYLLSMHIKNFMIPIGVGFAMLIASLIGISWSYGYIFPYTYCSMQFLTTDNKTNPGINIHAWALGYFLLFTIVNYALYIYRHQSRFHKKEIILLVTSVVVGVGLLSAMNWDKLESRVNKELSAEQQIKSVEDNIGFVRFKVDGLSLTTMEERMKRYNINGVSIAVIRDYKIIWAKGYGWADVEEKRTVMPSTLFEPGSISKSVNALGVMKLYEQKKLDLFTDINQYLTTWKFPYDSVSKGKKITLAQLLSHSAGLSIHGFGFTSYRAGDRLPTIPQILDGEKPSFTGAVRSIEEPGKKFRYSGGGTMISQLIQMDITGQPYDYFMQQSVLAPLKMINSFFTQPPPDSLYSKLATGYTSVYDGKEVNGKFPVQPQQAAAGLWTTATDLASMIIGIQLSLRGDRDAFLEKNTAQLMMTPYNDELSAFGFFIESKNSVKYFHHAAGNPGFSGKYFASLEGGNGVVVLVNSDDDPNFLEEVILSVGQTYGWDGFDKPREPVVKKAVNPAKEKFDEMTGAYLLNNSIVTVARQEGFLLLNAGGVKWRMWFTDSLSFFNIESKAEKKFLLNNNAISGIEFADEKNKVRVANKVSIINVSTLMRDKYAGQYLEPSNEVATIYAQDAGLWLKSENIVKPAKLNFLTDSTFFLDDNAGIYRFISDKSGRIKGIAPRDEEKVAIKRIP